MTITRPVLRYYGGKWKFASWIISFFPPHRTYCEVFGGAGSVLLRKPNSHTEIYNDIDGEVVNLFRVLRDKQQSKELIRLLKLTPLARTEYEEAFEIVEDPVERARRTIIRSHMGFNSIAINAGVTSGFRCSMRETGSYGEGWRNYPDKLIPVVDRLRRVIIENRSWQEILRMYDRPETLFYLDPPYIPQTRSEWKGRLGKGAYTFEMFEDDHQELLEALLDIQGMAIISGYHSDLYDDLLKDWDLVEKDTQGTANGDPRTEVLWLSPNMQVARLPLLHLSDLD